MANVSTISLVPRTSCIAFGICSLSKQVSRQLREHLVLFALCFRKLFRITFCKTDTPEIHDPPLIFGTSVHHDKKCMSSNFQLPCSFTLKLQHPKKCFECRPNCGFTICVKSVQSTLSHLESPPERMQSHAAQLWGDTNRPVKLLAC